MKRPRRSRRDPSDRHLDRVLRELDRTSPGQAAEDAERFICAFCSRPLRTCGTVERCACTEKMREGTVLAAYRRQTGRERPRCVSCGRPISVTLLRRNPLAEVCASCRRASLPHVQRPKEDRHGPQTGSA